MLEHSRAEKALMMWAFLFVILVARILTIAEEPD